MDDFYFPGNRALQDEFDSRKLADRLHEVIVHDKITEQDRGFIESRDIFFITTVDEAGWPTVSYKGGQQGFIRVVDEHTVAFPGYDGNGMFLTAGNIGSNNKVGLLFIDIENPFRIRAHGTATLDKNDALLEQYKDAQYIIRVEIKNLFINCSRYIHKYQKLDTSSDIPVAGCDAPYPEWKTLEPFRDVLPKT